MSRLFLLILLALLIEQRVDSKATNEKKPEAANENVPERCRKNRTPQAGKECQCSKSKTGEDPLWYKCECNGNLAPSGEQTVQKYLLDRMESELRSLNKDLNLKDLDELVVLCMHPVNLNPESEFVNQLTGLKKLELRDGKVHVETFGSMGNSLQTVWFRQMLLPAQTFSFAAFGELKNLKEADFSRSPFAGERLPCVAPFSELANLKHLNFQETGLNSFLPADCGSTGSSNSEMKKVKVRKLTLGRNSARVLGAKDLSWVRDLYDLSLDTGDLSTLELGALAHWHSTLGIVKVSSNPLSADAFKNLTSDLNACTALLTFEASALKMNDATYSTVYSALGSLPASLTTLQMKNSEAPPPPPPNTAPVIAHLNKLATLMLDNWGIEELDTGVWKVNTNSLAVLFLRHNNLHKWPHMGDKKAFENLGEYDVSFNARLGRLLATDDSGSFFTRLQKLRKFLAAGIGLEKIHSSILKRYDVPEQLQEVDFSNNKLRAFPLDAKLFAMAKRVKLATNRISDARQLFEGANPKRCPAHQLITELDLKGNPLANVTADLVRCLPSLKTLQLGDNEELVLSNEFLDAVDMHPSLSLFNVSSVKPLACSCANRAFFERVVHGSNTKRRYQLLYTKPSTDTSPDSNGKSSESDCSASCDESGSTHFLKVGLVTTIVGCLLSAGAFAAYRKRKTVIDVASRHFNQIRWCPGGHGISVRGDDPFQFHVYPIYHPEVEADARRVLDRLEELDYRVFAIPTPAPQPAPQTPAVALSISPPAPALTHDWNETRRGSLVDSSAGGSSSLSQPLLARQTAGGVGVRAVAIESSQPLLHDNRNSSSDPILNSQHVLVFMSSSLVSALLDTSNCLHEHLVGQLHKAFTRKSSLSARYGLVEIVQLDSVDWDLLSAPSSIGWPTTSTSDGTSRLEQVKQCLLDKHKEEHNVLAYNQRDMKLLVRRLRLIFGSPMPTSASRAAAAVADAWSAANLRWLRDASGWGASYHHVPSRASSTAQTSSEERLLPLDRRGREAASVGAPSELMRPNATTGQSGMAAARASAVPEDVDAEERVDSVSVLMAGAGSSVIELDRTTAPPAHQPPEAAIGRAAALEAAGDASLPVAELVRLQDDSKPEADAAGGKFESLSTASAPPASSSAPAPPTAAALASQLLVSFSPDAPDAHYTSSTSASASALNTAGDAANILESLM